jgi:hypothetical protein
MTVVSNKPLHQNVDKLLSEYSRDGAGGTGRGVKLTTHPHLVARSWKYGSIHPLPYKPSWRSDLLVKHRDNFTFLSQYILNDMSALRWISPINTPSYLIYATATGLFIMQYISIGIWYQSFVPSLTRDLCSSSKFQPDTFRTYYLIFVSGQTRSRGLWG